ncbi:MAG: hypothetical protein ACRDU5_10580 [Mycobacterium sp.]
MVTGNLPYSISPYSSGGIEYQGGEPSTALANAITKIISPGHVYTLSAEAQ